MLRVVGLATLAYVALFLYCLLDVARTDAAELRALPKAAWLLVIVVLPLVGCLAWLVVGRADRTPPVKRTRAHPRRVSRDHPSVRNTRRPPKGPDDDPAFLRRLDEQLRRSRPDDDADE